MTLARTADLVADAAAAGTAVIAFNVITLEHAEAIVAGAEAAGAPVILQVSQNAVAFHRGQLHPIARAAGALAEAAAVAVSLHLDHVESEALLQQAAGAGFSSAMYDAGTLPYRDNVAATRAARRWAHGVGLWLEAELGHVGGKPGAPASAHTAGVRTDPDEAVAYVAETGVDALAVAVGSSHAMTDRSAVLDHELIARLRAAVPVPLVLHGSSGVSDGELQLAIAAGIAKVNVGTALNMAMTTAIRRSLAVQDSVDPRHYLAPARQAMAETAEALLRVTRSTP